MPLRPTSNISSWGVKMASFANDLRASLDLIMITCIEGSLLITNAYPHPYEIIGQKVIDFIGPFYKTIMSIVKDFFQTDIVGFRNIFKSVAIHVVNRVSVA